MNLIFIDLETTGLDPSKHGIVEIGAIFVDNGRETSEFQSLTNPGAVVEYTPEAMQVNGLTMQQVNTAPGIGSVLRKFDNLCQDGALLAGWNVQFDVSFLHAAYKLCAIPWCFDYHVFDVWALFKQEQLKGRISANMKLSMANLFDMYQLPGAGQPQKHRALEDIRMTYELYKIL